MTLRILFVGDVVGRSGRTAIADHLPGMVRDWALDLVVVNGENAAGGFGITIVPKSATTISLPGVVCRPFRDAISATVDLSCIYRTDDHSPILQAFLASVQKFREAPSV